MPSYLSPGVYVKEVPSAVQPIAGVGTSTAGFIGVIKGSFKIPTSPVIVVAGTMIGTGDGAKKEFNLPLVDHNYPVNTDPKTYTIRVGQQIQSDAAITYDAGNNVFKVTLNSAPANNETITGDYLILANKVTNIIVGKGDGSKKAFELPQYPVNIKVETYEFRIDGQPESNVTVSDNPTTKKILVTFATAPADKKVITGDFWVPFPAFDPVPAKEVKLCTNFGDFKKYFGDFSSDAGQSRLAHAVYGFFNNGGTRCYVVRAEQESNITGPFLETTFEAIDEIALVCVPGITDSTVVDAIVTHCQQKTQGRFAIFDSSETVETSGSLDLVKFNSGANAVQPDNTNYGAFYFPWIEVFDPATKIANPQSTGRIFVPPSGHIAGIYARVDTNRGVFKAPANEPILGALGLKYQISKAQQDGLNPQGVNCIRDRNGNIRVWGARTLGGDANGEWKYVNVRRTFLFLRESIDEGLQWAVFEPNDPKLWAKITRNVTAFLTNVWRDGALFGNTPQEAFYVKCDAETNPPALRDLGQVVTEIGVAVVKPAEFVIFKISQWAGPEQK